MGYAADILPVDSCSLLLLYLLSSSCVPMNINTKEFFKEHRLECSFVVIASLVLFASRGKIQEYNAQSELEREAYQAAAQQVALIEAQEMAMQQAEPIAIARYERDCELIRNLTKDNTYTALGVGLPVIKGDYVEYYRENPVVLSALPHGHVLPAGMEVCDAYGNTTRLDLSADPALNGLPVAMVIATTTDKSVVNARIEREDSDAIKPNVKQ